MKISVASFRDENGAPGEIRTRKLCPTDWTHRHGTSIPFVASLNDRQWTFWKMNGGGEIVDDRRKRQMIFMFEGRRYLKWIWSFLIISFYQKSIVGLWKIEQTGARVLFVFRKEWNKKYPCNFYIVYNANQRRMEIWNGQTELEQSITGKWLWFPWFRYNVTSITVQLNLQDNSGWITK